MKRNAELCILGTGPAARICSLFLKNTPHLVVGNGPEMGSLSTFKIQGQEVNVIPIFPVYQSSLYKELWKENGVKHDFLEYIDFGDIANEFSRIQHLVSDANPDSYAARYYLKSKGIHTQKNILLAYKLLGNVMFTNGLRRLSDKVTRHYGSNLPNARIGFINGLSAYYDKLRTIPGEELLEGIKEIDIDNKRVITEQCEISYQRLISTLNLREMMRKVRGAPDIQLISKPASFFVVKTSSPLEPHKVIYDLELDSPIYRVFTIGLNIALVQLSILHSMADVGSKPIVDRLKQFFGQQFSIEFEYSYTIEDAYPLDSSSDMELNHFMSELEGKDVILLGRFAEWEYVDLHELDYSRIR